MSADTVPMYRRIYAELRHQIEHGQLQPGDTIPTEKELQGRYGVSRVPVRQALAALEKEGHIRRTPGRGTEVIHPQIAPWSRLSGFAHYYSRKADKLAVRTLSVHTVPADAEVANHLGLSPGQLVLRFCRMRFEEGLPIAYIQNFFPHALGVDQPDTGDDLLTLQQIIKRLLSREEVEVQEDLTAVLADGEVADALAVAPGTPLLFVTRLGWDGSTRPAEFSRYWARTHLMSYRTFLHGNSSRR